jgi:hypothetical protein
MSRKKKNAPVVIVRKDKRLHKGAHLAAFMLTGGVSGVVTAAKAGTNAGYNARTRKLQAQVEDAEVCGACHGTGEIIPGRSCLPCDGTGRIG